MWNEKKGPLLSNTGGPHSLRPMKRTKSLAPASCKDFSPWVLASSLSIPANAIVVHAGKCRVTILLVKIVIARVKMVLLKPNPNNL